MAGVRGRRMALSHLRRTDDPASRSLERQSGSLPSVGRRSTTGASSCVGYGASPAHSWLLAHAAAWLAHPRSDHASHRIGALAACHVAHPRRPGRRRGARPTRQRRRLRLSRSTPLWVRSRATRGGPVPSSEGHGAPQCCQPTQNRRLRPVRGSSYASQPPAVRSEGHWNHLSVSSRPPFPPWLGVSWRRHPQRGCWRRRPTESGRRRCR
ncbi:MAG: hypothetical protein ACJAZO_003751 [Myxococcota bacterium]